MSLPTEIWQHLCQKLDTAALVNLSETNPELFEACYKILQERKVELLIHKLIGGRLRAKFCQGARWASRESSRLTFYVNIISDPDRNRLIAKQHQHLKNGESEILPNMILGDYDRVAFIDEDDSEKIKLLYNNLKDGGYQYDTSLCVTGKDYAQMGILKIPIIAPSKPRPFPQSIKSSFYKRLNLAKTDAEILEDEGLIPNSCKNLMKEIEMNIQQFEENPSIELEKLIVDQLDELENFCSESYLNERERLRQMRGKLKYQEV